MAKFVREGPSVSATATATATANSSASTSVAPVTIPIPIPIPIPTLNSIPVPVLGGSGAGAGGSSTPLLLARDRDRERERSSKSQQPRSQSSSQQLPPPPPAAQQLQPVPPHVLPHPAEDLSADDDLLSWILVDQLGCMPNTKLGVHPQQVKFVGPPFKTDEVLSIVKETVTKGNTPACMHRLQEFHLIKSHLDSKLTLTQRERFISHLRRYLLIYQPNSRIELHLTSRYSFITGHTELAVLATKPLSPSEVVSELQGSVVPLPDQWRTEMEIGEDFAVEAAGEETDSESDDDDDASLTSSAARRDKGKGKELDGGRKGQRRSDRTKRRDFSIVWSGLKRCYQLFLGPARFLNHDCNPNVELLRQGKHVTFRVTKPIRIGEELTTFYGENYFGRGNIECLCLTCEQAGKGGFTPVSTSTSHRNSRADSRDSSAGPSRRDTSPIAGEATSVSLSTSREVKNLRPSSSLRNVVNGEYSAQPDDERSLSLASSMAGPSHSRKMSSLNGNGSLNNVDHADGADSTHDESTTSDMASIGTPTKSRNISSLKLTLPKSPTTESVASEPEPESPIDLPPRRERIMRKVVQNMKPYSFLQRPKKVKASQAPEADEELSEMTDDLPSDFPRCATCAKPLTEQIWFNGRYFEHCARCVRHALIFELPWPAHDNKDVREYPPSHMVPSGYIPRRISTVPLPTLNKAPKQIKPIVLPISPGAETRDMKRARKLREQIQVEEFYVESLREAAWSAQETKEAAIKAQLEAKEEAKRKRIEEKKARDQGKIKGSGVWQRYSYLTEDELKRREDEKHKVLSGTRRGGSFRAAKEEEEMKRLAEEQAKKQREEEEAELARLKAAESDAQSQAETDEATDTNTTADTSASSEIIVAPDAVGLRRTNGRMTGRAVQAVDSEEEEVAAAPELSAVRSPEKPGPSRILLKTSTGQRRSSSGPTPVSKPKVTAATPSTGASSAHISTASQASPVIDLTMSDDDDDDDDDDYISTRTGDPDSSREMDMDQQNGSPSSTCSSLRKRGRPKGTGRHQKAAALKIAREQARAAGVSVWDRPIAKIGRNPVPKSNQSDSSDEPVFLGQTSGDKGKGKAKATEEVASPLARMSSFDYGPLRGPASTQSWMSSSDHGPLRDRSTTISSPLKSGAFPSASISNPVTTSTASVQVPFPRLVDRYLPSSSSKPRVSDPPLPLPLPSASVSVSASNSMSQANEQPIRRKRPEIHLLKETAFALPRSHRPRPLDNNELSMGSTLPNTRPGQGNVSLPPLPGANHHLSHRNHFANGNHTSNGHTDKANGGPSVIADAAPDKKRKRVSDASDVSSSPSTSHGPEKKKRTFFPPLISVAMFNPGPSIPKPKHSLPKI
ncbi:hypothetical protein IAT40_005379 [Kwoniella sp. CBS 6097]